MIVLSNLLFYTVVYKMLHHPSLVVVFRVLPLHHRQTLVPASFELAYVIPVFARNCCENKVTFVSAETALCYSKRMIEKPNPEPHPWIVAARQRGWGEVMVSALDMVEPVAPVLAQMIWVVQPTVSLFGSTQEWAQFAEALETREGVAGLRKQLQEEDANID